MRIIKYDKRLFKRLHDKHSKRFTKTCKAKNYSHTENVGQTEPERQEDTQKLKAENVLGVGDDATNYKGNKEHLQK